MSKFWASKIVITILLVVFPVQAEERAWFIEPRATPVEMLQHLFRSPVTYWPGILEQYKYLLDDQFFENVEARIRWGHENGHHDDAERFSLVRLYAQETLGLSKQAKHALVNEATQGSVVLPTKDPVVMPEFDFTKWPNIVTQNRFQLTEDTYARVAESVEKVCRQGDYYRAAEFALLGDMIAAELGFTGTLRYQVVEAGGIYFQPNVPMDIDPRVVTKGYRMYGRYLTPDYYWRKKYEEAMKP